MNYDISFLNDTDEHAHGIKTVWDYARIRIAGLLHSPAARLEGGAALLALAALFGLPLLTWIPRWLQPGSIQYYAAWTIPLLLVWLRLNRFRVVLPELDSLNERFTERSVIRFLLEVEPEPQKRLRSPLILGCLLTPFALRLGDPTLTCLAFAVLLLGITAYRIGTSELRVLFFPFCMLFAAIPLPLFLLDGLNNRFSALFFKIATHLLQIAGYNAEMIGGEPNPLVLLGDGKNPSYRMFMGEVGTGLPEAGVFLLVTLFYLSLIEAPMRAKLAGMSMGIFWIGSLISLRLFAVAALHRTVDEEIMTMLIPLTRWLLPAAAFGGQLLILRGLKCRKFHDWVSV